MGQSLPLLPLLPMATKMVVGNALCQPVCGNHSLYEIWLPVLWHGLPSALWIPTVVLGQPIMISMERG